MKTQERGPIRRMGRLLEAVGVRLFSADDQAAIEHGWQIMASRGGLSRLYRDPRFDAVCACPECDSYGGTDSEPCVSCDGAGRVTWAASCREGQFP